MNKTQELRTNVKSMVAYYLEDQEDYASLCDNYRILVHTQKIMKRPPKKFLNGDWLKEEVKNFVLEQYLKKNWNPEFYMLYEDRAEYQIAAAMGDLTPYIGYFHRDWWLTWPDRVKLHKRFRELNPEMARLNDILELIVKTPPIMWSEPFYKKYLRELQKGIGKDLMKLLKLPKMQNILYEKLGVTFWTEGTELCSSAWSDTAGGAISLFKDGKTKSIAHPNAENAQGK